MLSKQQQKYVQSLHNKKIRQQENAFLVEGSKNIQELLSADYEVRHIYGTESYVRSIENQCKNYPITLVSEAELHKISTIQTNTTGLAVVRSLPNEPISAAENEWVLVLDTLNDPGNLGTIIRIADWYGITKIICSENTVEWYNPKVVMATMGSFTRVRSYYTSLTDFLSQQNQPILGAYLEGTSVYSLPKQQGGYLVIGSESHGIASNLEEFITKKVTIPRLGGAESLNAGVATAILLDNLLR